MQNEVLKNKNIQELVDAINQSLDLLKSYGYVIVDDEEESFNLVKLVKIYDYAYETVFEETSSLERIENENVPELINNINQSLDLLHLNNCIIMHNEDKIFNLEKIVEKEKFIYVAQFKE